MQNCCSGASGLLKVSIVVLLLAVILHLIGFSTPFWSERDNSNEGLWETCVSGNCINSFSDPISNEGWYKATQAFAILSFIFAVTSVALVIVAVCVPKLGRSLPIFISALVISFLTGLFIIIALTVYGTRGNIYLENAFGDPFQVGFSFVLFAISLFGYLFVALFIAIAINQVVTEDDGKAEDKTAAEKSGDPEKGTAESKPKDSTPPTETKPAETTSETTSETPANS